MLNRGLGYKTEIERIDLEALVASQIPFYKDYPKDRKFRVRCPDCPSEKSPAMSVLRDFRVGICFRCEKFFVNDTLETKLQTKEDFVEVIDEFSKSSHPQFLTAVNSMTLNLFDPIKDNEFLNNRNPFVEDWNYYGIRQSEGRVLTPYYMFGQLVYWQMRIYEPERRFLNIQKEAPLYIPSDVNKSPGKWLDGAKTILCEGPFDAIAIDCVRRKYKERFNIVALGGKVLTEYRIQLLKSLGCNDFVVFLDETKLSESISWGLRYNFGGTVQIVPSDGRDPEEWLRELGEQKFFNKLQFYLNSTPLPLLRKELPEDDSLQMIDLKLF